MVVTYLAGLHFYLVMNHMLITRIAAVVKVYIIPLWVHIRGYICSRHRVKMNYIYSTFLIE